MNTVQEFAKLATDSIAYDETKKRRFHRLGKAVLKLITQELGLSKSEYTIRSNMGGVAVSGEVILHTDRVYVQFSQSAFLLDSFMYRACDGKDDFCGAGNNWYKYSQLGDLKDFVSKLRKVGGYVGDSSGVTGDVSGTGVCSE
jgi:hypothetical protein